MRTPGRGNRLDLARSTRQRKAAGVDRGPDLPEALILQLRDGLMTPSHRVVSWEWAETTHPEVLQ